MPKKKIKEDIELDFEENEIKYSDAKRKAKKYNNMLKKAQNFMSNRLDDIEELMAFYEGSQYKLATYENNKPWVVQMNTPHASVNIDIRVSSLVALDYVGVLEPYSPDDKDKVDVLQSIIEDLWGEMDLNSKITKAIHTGAIIREGYIHIMYDSKKIKGGKNRRMKGQIEAYPLDTAHVWLDPEARTFEDCNYIAVTERTSKNIVYKKYPFLKGRLNGSAFSPSQRGEIFANNDYTTEQDDVVTKVIMYVKEYNDSGTSFVIKQYILIEDCLVEENTLTGLKRFPIAQFKWKSSSNSAYGMSLMDDLLCLQKAINAIESATTNTAIAYASPSFVMKRACGVSPIAVAKASGAPGAVFVVDGDPSTAIVPLVPPKIDDKIINIKAQFESTMQSIAGISNSYVGALGTAGNTTGSAELAIDRAKIIETLVISNIETFVEQLTMILADYVISLYSGKKDPIYTRRRDESTGELTFNEYQLDEDIKNVDFSFYVDLSTRTKFSQEQEARVLKELYQQERQYDAPIKLINELDILNASQTKNKEYLRDRYKREVAINTEQKVNLINKLMQIGQQYNLDPGLIANAQSEVINNDAKMQYTQQVLQMAQQAVKQYEGQVEQTNQDLVAAGYDPNLVREASESVLQNGMNADMFKSLV